MISLIGFCSFGSCSKGLFPFLIIPRISFNSKEERQLRSISLLKAGVLCENRLVINQVFKGGCSSFLRIRGTRNKAKFNDKTPFLKSVKLDRRIG